VGVVFFLGRLGHHRRPGGVWLQPCALPGAAEPVEQAADEASTRSSAGPLPAREVLW